MYEEVVLMMRLPMPPSVLCHAMSKFVDTIPLLSDRPFNRLTFAGERIAHGVLRMRTNALGVSKRAPASPLPSTSCSSPMEVALGGLIP